MTHDYHGRYAEFAVIDDPSLPERFQNYSIDKNKIGEGPISLCYRAQRIDTNETVRLKVFRRRLSLNSGNSRTIPETKSPFLGIPRQPDPVISRYNSSQ